MWHRQAKIRQEDISSRHLWLISYTMASEAARTCFVWAIFPVVVPATFGHPTACRSPPLIFSVAIHFAMKHSAPCSAVLRHSPSFWAAVVHWLVLMPKALRSSRKHPIHSYFWLTTQPPTTIPNITHLGSLVFSMCATNPAIKIRLLRLPASILSLSVLISVSR